MSKKIENQCFRRLLQEVFILGGLYNRENHMYYQTGKRLQNGEKKESYSTAKLEKLSRGYNKHC